MIVEIGGIKFMQLSSGNFKLLDNVEVTEVDIETAAATIFKHHSHRFGTSYVMGNWCINGCQTFHKDDAQRVFDKHNVPESYREDIMSAFGNFPMTHYMKNGGDQYWKLCALNGIGNNATALNFIRLYDDCYEAFKYQLINNKTIDVSAVLSLVSRRSDFHTTSDERIKDLVNTFGDANCPLVFKLMLENDHTNRIRMAFSSNDKEIIELVLKLVDMNALTQIANEVPCAFKFAFLKEIENRGVYKSELQDFVNSDDVQCILEKYRQTPEFCKVHALYDDITKLTCNMDDMETVSVILSCNITESAATWLFNTTTNDNAKNLIKIILPGKFS